MLNLLALLAAAAAATPPGPTAEASAPPITVHFADGSQQTLVRWTLAYEFLVARPGDLPKGPLRRESQALQLGSSETPLGGTSLEIEYRPVEIERTTDNGDVVRDKVVRAGGLRLLRGGKKKTLKVQAPDREFLMGKDKSVNVLPQTLGLLGETLAGTRRELCLFSLSNFADCAPADDARVVRIDFP